MKNLDISSKTVRKISLVSSALFNISACVYNWMSPIGIALSCISDLGDIHSDYKELTNEQALIEVIEQALKKTLENTTLQSHKDIIEELCNTTVDINNFEDIIKQTEAYQVKYCTNADAKAIISNFEYYFIDCLSHYDALSRLYILTMEYSALEELKKISGFVSDTNKKLDDINNTVNETNNLIFKLKQQISVISQEMSYILVSMSIFLMFGIFTEYGFPNSWIFVGLTSYILSSYLIHNLVKDGRIYETLYSIKLHMQTDPICMKIPKILSTLLLPSIISTACFLIYVSATYNRSDPALIYAIVGLMLGNYISSLLRTTKYNN